MLYQDLCALLPEDRLYEEEKCDIYILEPNGCLQLELAYHISIRKDKHALS